MAVEHRYQQLFKITLTIFMVVFLVQVVVNVGVIIGLLYASWMSFPLSVAMALLLHLKSKPRTPTSFHYGLLIFWSISLLVAVYCTLSMVFEPERARVVSTMAPLLMFVVASPPSIVTIIIYHCRQQKKV